MALASNMDLQKASELANYTAGIKVGKFGTAAVKLEEIEGKNSEIN